MRLIWTSEARQDLAEIVDYIAEHNARASVRILRLLEDAADRLPDHPFMFRRGRQDGTREAVVHPNYILVYQVLSETIEILSVLHTRQRYP